MDIPRLTRRAPGHAVPEKANQELCRDYNRASGCSKNPCRYRESSQLTCQPPTMVQCIPLTMRAVAGHACALCGDNSHSAQTCSKNSTSPYRKDKGGANRGGRGGRAKGGRGRGGAARGRGRGRGQ